MKVRRSKELTCIHIGLLILFRREPRTDCGSVLITVKLSRSEINSIIKCCQIVMDLMPIIRIPPHGCPKDAPWVPQTRFLKSLPYWGIVDQAKGHSGQPPLATTQCDEILKKLPSNYLVMARATRLRKIRKNVSFHKASPRLSLAMHSSRNVCKVFRSKRAALLRQRPQCFYAPAT